MTTSPSAPIITDSAAPAPRTATSGDFDLREKQVREALGVCELGPDSPPLLCLGAGQPLGGGA